MEKFKLILLGKKYVIKTGSPMDNDGPFSVHKCRKHCNDVLGRV